MLNLDDTNWLYVINWIGDLMNVDYTEISKTYDNYRWFSKNLIKKIIEFGKVNEGMKILDIGCGTGNVAFQLLELINTDIIDVDISVAMHI